MTKAAFAAHLFFVRIQAGPEAQALTRLAPLPEIACDRIDIDLIMVGVFVLTA
jgi:hypothetical protein